MTLPLLRPFPALRPAAGRAPEVAAPPYDVVNSDEARQMAADRPLSFLHVSKPEIDLAPETDVYSPAVYEKASENFRKLISDGVLVQDPKPMFYVYRAAIGDYVQTGLVGAASIDAYETGRIKRHELTRPAKEDDRVRQIEAVAAHTGPIMTAHRPDSEIRDILARTSQNQPTCTAVVDGAEHTIWAIDDDDTLNALTAAFERLDAIYIADGHHRSNAAVRVAKARREAGAAPRGDEWSESFLTVVFPSDDMRILDYNRIVSDLNGLSETEFLARLENDFSVRPVAGAGEAKPAKRGEFGLYVGGRWYGLELKQTPPGLDAVAGLDISLLTRFILEPVLAIGDPRLDPRIDFVGGVRGLGELEKRVDSGEMAAAFAVFATSLDDLMAVSDADQVMPPKSTWFEPKLADGLLSLMLD
jgi:uncharacterized protein (DUF1015 family)